MEVLIAANAELSNVDLNSLARYQKYLRYQYQQSNQNRVIILSKATCILFSIDTGN